LLFPAGFLVVTLAAFQFLGDALRDWLDVRDESGRDVHEKSAAS
jgi:oligopeptide transport system permease protein